jgi:hypothetical protein
MEQGGSLEKTDGGLENILKVWDKADCRIRKVLAKLDKTSSY